MCNLHIFLDSRKRYSICAIYTLLERAMKHSLQLPLGNALRLAVLLSVVVLAACAQQEEPEPLPPIIIDPPQQKF